MLQYETGKMDEARQLFRYEAAIAYFDEASGKGENKIMLESASDERWLQYFAME